MELEWDSQFYFKTLIKSLIRFFNQYYKNRYLRVEDS